MNKASLAKYGLGLGLRRDLVDQTLGFYQSQGNQKLIEWLELVPENYILRGGVLEARYQRLRASGIPLIPHGVNLSIGSANWRDMDLLAELRDLFREIKAPWFSDHLSCTYIDGAYTQDLIPVPFTAEAVNIISDNIKYLQDYFQLPFLIENPSYYTKLIPPEMTEAEFINRVLEQADCGMLLDVNNVYVNSVNHGYNAREFISQLDLERVVQVHIAGHLEGYKSSLTGHKIAILDTHGEGIKTEVYDLLRYLLERTEVNAILLERDSNFPDFSELVAELGELRKIMDDSNGLLRRDAPRNDNRSLQARHFEHNLSLRADRHCERSEAIHPNSPLPAATIHTLADIQLEIKNYLCAKPLSGILNPSAINELSIYKSLIISAIGDLLESVYPLSKQVIEDWDNIVIQYTETYPSQSPVFNRAAESFPEFLRASKQPDWLCELAQYEWAELAVEIEPVNAANNFKILSFKYPISQIVNDRHCERSEAIHQPNPEQILIYCDPDTHHSKKFKLNTITTLALTAILEGFSDEDGIDSLAEILNITAKPELEKLKEEYFKFKTFIISNNIIQAINYKSAATA